MRRPAIDALYGAPIANADDRASGAAAGSDRIGGGAADLEVFESLQSLESEWRAISARDPNVFGTWEWCSTWWRHFGRGRPVAIVGWRAGGRLVGLIPLYRSRGAPLRMLRLIGHPHADVLGPVCAPEDVATMAVALGRVAHGEGIRGWDLMLCEALPATAGWREQLGGTIIRATPSPVLATAGRSWDDFLGDHRRFAKELRSKERRLEEQHTLRYRQVEDPERLLAGDFDTLVRLHRARWGASTENAFSGGAEAFHREFARVALERGWLHLWFLELDGVPVAAKYNLRFGGVDWSYQSGRDPAWDRSSVGTLLFARALRDGFEAGVSEYRLLRGDEAYKDRFATGDVGCEMVVATRTVAGRLAVAVVTAAGRFPRAREWIRARAG